MLIIFLEADADSLRRGRYRRRLYHHARFLFVPPYRGYFYLFLAFIEFAQVQLWCFLAF